MGVRRRLAVPILCALLLGCGQQEPASLPALTPPTGPSAAAPVAAQAATPQGAAAFVRFWYAEITRAWAARDASIVQRLSAPGCMVCQRYIDSMKGTRARGERVDPVVFTITLAEAMGLTGDTTRVSVIYNHPETRRYDSSGRQLSVTKARQGVQETVDLVRHGPSWLVAK